MADSYPNPIENADYQRKAARETPAPMTVESTPAQILRGTKIGVGERGICDGCGRSVGELSQVAVRAHRHSDESRWSAAAVYCAGCRPESGTIHEPTTGMAELVVAGELVLRSDPAEQQHYLVFCPESGTGAVLDYSDPDNGSAP